MTLSKSISRLRPGDFMVQSAEVIAVGKLKSRGKQDALAIEFQLEGGERLVVGLRSIPNAQMLGEILVCRDHKRAPDPVEQDISTLSTEKPWMPEDDL